MLQYDDTDLFDMQRQHGNGRLSDNMSYPEGYQVHLEEQFRSPNKLVIQLASWTKSAFEELSQNDFNRDQEIVRGYATNAIAITCLAGPRPEEAEKGIAEGKQEYASKEELVAFSKVIQNWKLKAAQREGFIKSIELAINTKVHSQERI